MLPLNSARKHLFSMRNQLNFGRKHLQSMRKLHYLIANSNNSLRLGKRLDLRLRLRVEHPGARDVACAKGFEFDDVRAIVAQHGGAKRASQCVGQVEYVDAFKREFHRYSRRVLIVKIEFGFEFGYQAAFDADAFARGSDPVRSWRMFAGLNSCGRFGKGCLRDFVG